MKKLSKVFTGILLACVLALSAFAFVACNKPEEKDNKITEGTFTFTHYAFDATIEQPNTSFLKAAATIYPNGEFGGISYQLTLEVKQDATYTLNVKNWYADTDPDGSGDPKQGDIMFFEVSSVASGTYTSTEDTITIAKPTAITMKCPDLGMSYMTMFAPPYSYYNAEEDADAYGTWTLTDTPEVAAAIPAACFYIGSKKISNGLTNSILNWVDIGYKVSAASTQENSSENMYFYYDDSKASDKGTFYYTNSEKLASNSGTWTLVDGTLTLSYQIVTGYTEVEHDGQIHQIANKGPFNQTATADTEFSYKRILKSEAEAKKDSPDGVEVSVSSKFKLTAADFATLAALVK